VVLSTSVDGGATWSAPRFVNQDGAVRRANHFTPAVAAYGGVVLVTFRNLGANSTRVGMRWVASADGGATFGRERRLGRPSDNRFAATSAMNAFLGDYMGLAMSANAAHAVWCTASRPPPGGTQHQTTWSATIRR